MRNNLLFGEFEMLKKITKEELIKKYGEMKFKFNSYNKYLFIFLPENQPEEFKIRVSTGGCSEDIYRLDVGVQAMTLKECFDYGYDVNVYDESKNKLYSNE